MVVTDKDIALVRDVYAKKYGHPANWKLLWRGFRLTTLRLRSVFSIDSTITVYFALRHLLVGRFPKVVPYSELFELAARVRVEWNERDADGNPVDDQDQLVDDLDPSLIEAYVLHLLANEPAPHLGLLTRTKIQSALLTTLLRDADFDTQAREQFFAGVRQSANEYLASHGKTGRVQARKNTWKLLRGLFSKQSNGIGDER